MEKIVKAYCFPQMEQARLVVTQNQIQVNKFGVNWLNSKYVQLSIKKRPQTSSIINYRCGWPQSNEL